MNVFWVNECLHNMYCMYMYMYIRHEVNYSCELLLINVTLLLNYFWLDLPATSNNHKKSILIGISSTCCTI